MVASSASTLSLWVTHLILGIVGGICVLSLGGIQPVALWMAFGLLTSSAVLAFLSHHHLKHHFHLLGNTTPKQTGTLQAQSSHGISAAQNLQISALPLLADQIDIANLYMEEEVIFLTSGFYGLIHQSGRLSEYLDEELGTSTIDFRQECDILRREINKVMVLLQFQDRVSQVLTHVSNDLRQMQLLLEVNTRLLAEGNPANDIHIEEWLRDLKQSYTMSKQMIVHHGVNKSLGKASAQDAVDPEVTFF